jgi:hypothetical protein
MKIQLERALPNCPSHLTCVACFQQFEVEKIRALLYNHVGLIQGDLCHICRSAEDLQQKLQTNEEISRPRFYEWWFKRLAILSEATQEIEQARFSSLRCGCGKSRQIRIRFQPDDR